MNVTNDSDTPWGDFHFEIFSDNGSDISQVDIVDVVPFRPTTDRMPFTYVVDNEAVGSTLDDYFYSDPVDVGESASFTFSTDNTARRVNFAVLMYPTPVPEPEVLSMVCSGLAAILLIRRGHGRVRTSGRRRNRQGDPGKQLS